MYVCVRARVRACVCVNSCFFLNVSIVEKKMGSNRATVRNYREEFGVVILRCIGIKALLLLLFFVVVFICYCDAVIL